MARTLSQALATHSTSANVRCSDSQTSKPETKDEQNQETQKQDGRQHPPTISFVRTVWLRPCYGLGQKTSPAPDRCVHGVLDAGVPLGPHGSPASRSGAGCDAKGPRGGARCFCVCLEEGGCVFGFCVV